uniref:Zf-AD domain-containing protein n=1 Tax=Caenorhabditis tropicalis TaxID=1561998 RepID=A0A1I7TRM6_9PELO
MSEATESIDLQLEGGAGDIHCLECLKISNYLQDVYCCDKIRNMNILDKECKSVFLMVCFQRHVIGKMITAILEGKKIVDKSGNCVFCRNKKQHEEDKWCAGKTKLELYLHIIDKEEMVVERCLEKFLEVRLRNREKELKKVHERIRREMAASIQNSGKTDQEIDHLLKKQGREARRQERKQSEKTEEENQGIRDRVSACLQRQKQETIKKMEEAATQ